jgi:hypothetical protein
MKNLNSNIILISMFSCLLMYSEDYIQSLKKNKNGSCPLMAYTYCYILPHLDFIALDTR